MANRIFNQFQLSLVRNRVSLFPSMTIGASGAVTSVNLPASKGVASIVRNSTGNYTITFGYYSAYTGVTTLDTYKQLLMASFVEIVAGVPAADLTMSVVADTTSAGTLTIQFSFGAAAIDPPSGSTILMDLELIN